MASVKVVEHGNGDVSIGVDIGDAYVPFAQVSAARIAGLQERARDLDERLKDDDDAAARDAVAALPHSSSVKAEGKSEGGGS
jgi:hypothetical protein